MLNFKHKTVIWYTILSQITVVVKSKSDVDMRLSVYDLGASVSTVVKVESV